MSPSLVDADVKPCFHASRFHGRENQGEQESRFFPENLYVDDPAEVFSEDYTLESGTTIVGIAVSGGKKLVGGDTRSTCITNDVNGNLMNGSVSDFAIKLHEIGENVVAASAGCTAWSKPIISRLLSKRIAKKKSTPYTSAKFAASFLGNEKYQVERQYFKKIPNNFDIQKESCEMLFTGKEDDGRPSMFFANKYGFKEVVEAKHYRSGYNQINTWVSLGSGSQYVKEHVSVNDEQLIALGGGSSHCYRNILLKSLRTSALNDDQTGGFGIVYDIDNGKMLQYDKVTLHDFNVWTAMIEETEKMVEGWQGSIQKITKLRAVYGSFLAEFPLCHVYWKKYADHVYRLGSDNKFLEMVEVYERAFKVLAYSVDYWLSFCTSVISRNGTPGYVRGLFERGLGYVGTDYLSYPLWDKYIEYESSQFDQGYITRIYRITMIYMQVLERPNQDLDRYFTGFYRLAGKIPGTVEEMYRKSKEFVSKIVGFERAMTIRPYFEVQPLDESQLENWHKYLDFIEGEGDFDKVVKLYERCLIACANYPEFWIRYVLRLEAGGKMDLAYKALARATQIFVKRHPEIHLFSAGFLEQNRHIEQARAAYNLVHSGNSPGRLEAIIQHANMEYRLGNEGEAFSLYEQAINAEAAKRQSQILPMLVVQYAHFLYLVGEPYNRSSTYLDWFLLHVKLLKSVLEYLIHLESIQPGPKRIDHLDSLVEKYIMPGPDNSASTTDREEVSSKFVKFLDVFGNTKSIKKAWDRHAKLFSSRMSFLGSSTQFGKRSAEDCLVSDKAKLAKSYTGLPSYTDYGSQNQVK